MKNDNSSDIELIERYFDGEASAEEVSLYEQKFSLDPDFRAKAELQQKAIVAIRLSKRSELKQMLQDLDDTLPPVYPPPSKWKKILVMLLFAMGLIAGAVWWLKGTPPAPDQAALIAQYYPAEAIDDTRRGAAPLRDAFLNCLQAADYNCAVGAYSKLSDAEKGFEENQLDYAYALIQVGQSDKAIQLLQELIAKPAVNLQKSRWYLGFAYLKSGDKNACRAVLKQIDKTHYQDKARALLGAMGEG